MHRALKCPGCGSGLAHTQRYCVECGIRVRSLPGHVRSTLAAMARGRRTAGGPVPGEENPFRAGPEAGAPRVIKGPFGTEFTLPEFELPTPRSVAAATVGLLAFGIGIGAADFGFAGSPYDLLLDNPPHASHPASSISATTGSATSTPARTVTTVTVTSDGSRPQQNGVVPSGGGSGIPTTSTSTTPQSSGLPPVHHVFIITFSDQSYDQTFSPTTGDAYLAKSLANVGEVIPDYFSATSGNLASDVATLSGQGPTRQTADDCPSYQPFKLEKRGEKLTTTGQLLGSGCVYPTSAPTLMSQLQAAHDSWRAYAQTAGKSAAPSKTWNNPVDYFASVTGAKDHAREDVPLTQLRKDLQSVGTTPNLSLIYPDTCDDGSDTACKPGAKDTGIGGADSFVQSILGTIINSPAYKQDGLVIITFDQAAQHGTDSGKYISHLAMTGTPSYPNLGEKSHSGGGGYAFVVRAHAHLAGSDFAGTTTSTTTATTSPTSTTTTTSCTGRGTGTSTGTIGTTTGSTGTGTTTGSTTGQCSPVQQEPPCLTLGQCTLTGGGGQVGMVAISQWIKAKTVDNTDVADNFSLLYELEALFGLDKTIGYATTTLESAESAGGTPFGHLFNNYTAPTS